MAIKKKKENIADQIINGTYDARKNLKNNVVQNTNIVERVQQRANNILNNSNNNISIRSNELTKSTPSIFQNNYKQNSKKELPRFNKNNSLNKRVSSDVNSIVSNFGLGIKKAGESSLSYIESMSNRSQGYKKYNQSNSIESKKQNEWNELKQQSNKQPISANIRKQGLYNNNNILSIIKENQSVESPINQYLNKKINKDEERIQKNVEKSSNKVSRKIAELMPSIGQSVSGMGISAVNPGLGLAFWQTSAGGDYIRDAKSRGMKDEDALKYGTIMGAMESATEWVGGELAKGVGKAVAKDGVVKGLKALGLDIGENFFEEAIMEPIQESVASMTGGKETSDWNDMKKRMLQSGIDGALTSIIMGGASAGIGKATNLVEKAQAGKTITQEEIADVLKEINKQEEIDIEKVLVDSFGFGSQDLYINKDAQNRTDQRLENVAEGILQDEAKEIIKNSNLSDESKASLLRVAEKHNMSTEEVQNLINNPPNEQVSQNNQQVVQPDNKTAQNGNIEQTKPILQNYLKNASDNGLDVQNKTVKSIYEVTQRRGIVTEYNEDVFKNEKGEVDTNKNAVWTTDENGNRKILINPNADTETTLQNIMVHELTHDFEGSKEYDALSKLALDKMKTQEGYLEARKDLERIYSQVYDKNSKEFQTLVDQEAVANFLGENLGNQEFINELVNSQPRTTIQKIYDWVVDKIAKVTGNEKLYWKNVEQKFKNAYNSQNVNSNQDSKYSVETLSDGTIYIRDEQNKFTKSDGTKMTPREVYNSLVGKEIDLGDGDKVFILKRLPGNKDLYKELFTRYPKIFNNINDVKKLNTDVNYNIEELLQNSKNILPNEPDKLNRHQKQGIITFDTRIVNFYDGNNAYNIEFSIAKLQDGRKVAYAKRQFDYDDNLTQKIKADETRSSNSPLNQQPLLNNSIPSSNENVNTTTKYSMQENKNNTENSEKGSFSIPKLKEKQLEIINKSNPMLDDYHLGIRSIEDIKTFDEVINDDESFVYGDFSKEDAEKALEKGTVTVYSSKPIEQGNFVSTSKNMAQDYAGRNGKVYSQEVSLNDVAWINGDEGQYAKIEQTSTKDSQGRELSKGQQEYFKDSKVRDEKGNLLEVYHGSPNNFTEFDKSKIGSSTDEGLFGRGFYFTDDKSYADAYNGGKIENTKKVYLDIKKPYIIDSQESMDKFNNIYLKETKDQLEYFEKYGVDYFDKFLDDSTKELRQMGYDGVIVKPFGNFKGIECVVFEPNQIKNVDNLNPTDNPDTRFSYQSNGAWNDFLKKHSINKGTGETMQQVKLPQMPIENFQKVLDNAKHIPQEEKNYLLETVKDIKRNKTSLEDFKNTIETMEEAYDEQNENILDTKKTYNTGRKETYQKYMKANTEYDSSSLENAKNIVPANHQGRRTKAQWLNIAKQMGTEIANKSNAEIEEIAYRTWQDERPSNKESLNRQGDKFVQFTSDEWINTIYDAVKEQREKYSIDTGENKGIDYFDEDLQAIREASEKGLGDTMTINEQIEAIQNLNSKGLDNKLENTSSKIVDKLSKEKTPFKQRVAEVRKLITNKGAFVDDLFKATGNKQGRWKYDRYLGSFSEGQVSIGVNQINSDGEIIGDSLLDIYKNAKKNGITQKILDDYVLNKDNISRSKYEKYIFGEEISARDSQRIIDEYDKKYPQLKEYAKQVSDYADNNTKGYLVGTFISQDLHNKLRQMYPDHVPVVRDISETPGLAEYDNVGAQVLKRATGGNQEILSPKEALAQQSVTYARAFRRNEALKEVYKSIKSDTKVLYDLGKIIDIEQANDCIKNAISYDDTLNKYTATVFENGEAKVFEISKGIFDAFNNDTIFDKIDRGLENSLPGKVLKKSTETFKGLTTGKNILYALKNMARDINDAPINSTTNFANYMKDWAYAYEQIVTNGKYYKEYVNAGGNANTFYDYSKGLIKKDFSSLPKKAINFINNQTIGRVEQINEVVETAPRLAEYIATRQRGGSIDEALYNSAEVTTNFKRGGELSKLVDKYGVPYLNASIQGLSKVYRNVSEAKGFKQYAKLAVNATLAGVLPSVINHLVYDDDDDYEELPDYIKDGYYLIKVTNLPNGLQNKLKKWTENNFVRIPKGRISAVLGGTAVRLHENLNDEGEDVWNGYMSDVVLNNIGINNPLTNNLFSGLIQATRNEAWYGGSIYSESKYKNKLPVEITDEKTTQLSNWIAETIHNMVGDKKYKELIDKENGNTFFKVLATPKLLDYVMDQYSGIVGDIVMPMLTPYAENNALVDQFTTSSTLKSTTVSKFYEILGNCYQNSEYATDTDKLTYKYLEEVSKEVGGMYAEKSSIQSDSTLTDKQKQQKTYEIQEQINQKMEEAINSVENMKLTSNTAEFNGTEYYKDDEGKWKAITDNNKIEGLSTETYADYKKKLSNALKEKKETDGEDAQLTTKERLKLLESSTYLDKEKDEIYSQTTGQKDKVYSNLKKLNKNDLSSIDEYLNYKTSDFSADKEDDGSKNGKSISGSAKAKVIKFINDSNLSDVEKMYLYGTKYKLNKTEREQFAEYVDTLKLSDDEIKELYLTLNGVVEMSDGSIKWK